MGRRQNKKIIINADDFGLSPGCTKGIIDAFHSGSITSVSIMTNVQDFHTAASFLKENKNLGVGVHLNLVYGKPVLDPSEVPTLVGAEGNFMSVFKFLSSMMAGKIRLEEVEKELDAQIKKTIEVGLTVDHLDGHDQGHLLPGIFPIVCDLALRYDIKAVRILKRTRRSLNGQFFKTVFFKTPIFFLLHFLSARTLNVKGLRTSDYTYGVLNLGKMSAKVLESIILSRNGDVIEIIVHPAYVDDDLRRTGNLLVEEREDELKSLLKPEFTAELRESDIQLCRFSDVFN